MEFEGKNVVFVGGFGGIGFATCKLIVKKSVANLTILDIQENASCMKELTEMNPDTKVHFVQLDLCDKNRIVEVIKEVIAMTKYIDILINGSGIVDEANPDRVMAINLIGMIHTVLNVIPYMDKANGGHGGLIVNISSIAGLEPVFSHAVYSASKHGIMGFSRSISSNYYYERTGIAVIIVCPGVTTTSLLETRTKCTFPYSDVLKYRNVETQTPDECAESLVKAMETGKNGSIWMLDIGELKEVEVHKYWDATK